jgi:hypothetical protein
MAVVPLALGWRAGIALAQASSPPPDRPKVRQPTQSSVQQQKACGHMGTRAGPRPTKRLREMDRRLNRTPRRVCIGC